ncbi:MAG: 4Fe-4S binding protein [Fusobacteriaceae bacterium]
MYVIDKDTCIGCGACEGTCPVGAISADANGKYEICDACVDCGACASVCPVEAISA